MFAKLQQSIADLAGKVDGLAEQVKRDKTLWEVDHHNLAILIEDFNQFAGEVREDKDVINGSLQRIQKDLDQNTEILTLPRATVDEQTWRLDHHETKLQDQQNASFFGNKNSLDKLDEFKEKQDRQNSRLLEVEDWVRAQAQKNLTLEPVGRYAFMWMGS
ncbi:hypothetical protein ACLB2K_031406 [Fragaria x ananassa]